MRVWDWAWMLGLAVLIAIGLMVKPAEAPARDLRAPIYRYGWATNAPGSVALATLVIQFDGTGWLALTGKDQLRNATLSDLTVRPFHFDLNTRSIATGAR